ncbi:arginase [Halobacteroides halobius DSM 5150]|uniref:Arginase n=1 Tax=Halobacteroides halobius (strain ATCC 35273 / DSM 5150 / MD-1) TaxID=748449 RepID=L0K4N7_HALHC|nr:arginase [Halobacteroides halobius]AGB40237.1 arginase [Halobacteroides halobius DSM 5150]
MEVKVLGVPTDFGANRRGVDMGPSAIRYANLVSSLEDMDLVVDDLGDIRVPVINNEANKEEAKFLSQVIDVCQELALIVSKIAKQDKLPVILGGDHSITIGSVAGMAQVKEMGLIWFDAHGDFNTLKTSESGNIHGMPLATIVGRGVKELVECGGITPKVKEKNTVIVGVRDLDKEERQLLKESEVTVFTMDDIDRLGIYKVMSQAIRIIGSQTAGVHISFDLDVLDPLEAPGVGTPVKGGLTYREAHLALEMIAEANIVASLDLVEVNPILDQGNQTAELAVELIASALGKRIL